ncbi:MAG: hypothetical protein JST01_08645 [Cyanobacteria bacterium SZAS TMP-1]|nr:hypothetical protein [Cyanobacteria bacterium SZAS TMP-1]
MDYLFYGFSFLVAASLLFAVAESDRLMELIKPKGKKCQSNYWGVYEGTSATVSVGEVEAKAPNAKHRNIMGSATYAAGKGVRMSGG